MTDKPHMTLPNGDIIREGDYARTRDGQKVGPLYILPDPHLRDCPWYASPNCYTKHGYILIFGDHPQDLIAKWRDVAPGPDPVAPDYNNGEWHTWNGGECPVHPMSVVEVTLRAGVKPNPGGWTARDWYWWHGVDSSDIVSFRVVTPYVEPAPEPVTPPAKRRKWWIVENRVFDSARQAKIAFPGSTPIKVKECKK